MEQAYRLIEALKQILKSREITYREMARLLGMSEANLKRLFSKRAFSLAQLDKICEILETDFYELAKRAREKTKDVQQVLTIAQEKALAEEPQLFVCFYLILAGWDVQYIETKYHFSTKLISLLLRLEKLELIQVLPKNRIKPLVSPNVRWNIRGPLKDKYEKNIKTEFLDGTFLGKMEKLRFLSGSLNEGSLRLFSEKVDRLIGEFIDLTQVSSLDKRQGAHENIWFLLAFRPWSLSIMSRYKK